jgi:hypothetical protein
MVYIPNIWVIRLTTTAPADDATIGKVLLHKDFLSWHVPHLKAQFYLAHSVLAHTVT